MRDPRVVHERVEVVVSPPFVAAIPAEPRHVGLDTLRSGKLLGVSSPRSLRCSNVGVGSPLVPWPSAVVQAFVERWRASPALASIAPALV